MNRIAAELVTRFPERVVTRSLADFADRKERDLEAGVFTVLAMGEHDYANWRGRDAQLGKMDVAILGQIKLPERACGQDVEDAEFALVEELQAFVQEMLPEEICTLTLLRYRTSGQLETPYGWVLAELELMP